MKSEGRLQSPPVIAAAANSVTESPQPAWSMTNSIQSTIAVWNWRSWHAPTMLSLFLHLIALGVCGLIVLKSPQFVEEIFTTVTRTDEAPDEPIIERSMLPHDDARVPEDESLLSPTTTTSLPLESIGPIDLNIDAGIPQFEKALDDAPGIKGIRVADAVSGRMSAQSRKEMVEKYGGNTASEAAVAAGLKWLITHQMPNGSWNFEHSRNPLCKGQCSQNGNLKSCHNGATALALLTFLGAGHTHQFGDYQKEVKRGFEFLLKTAKRSGEDGLDFRGFVVRHEGMYVHGLCALALCECAAMTDDPRMRKAAQGAVDFIVKAQNPVDGGWRYVPKAPGDLSVAGWQVMALKSGYNAKLEVPTSVFRNASGFLDLTQANRGTLYRYMPDIPAAPHEPTGAMTAVGLLCRMYLGWDRTEQRLVSGVQYLDQLKPQPDNMYFNYYATQVMRHWGGEEWTRWNDVMRDQLVRTQQSIRSGHMAGSWDVADPRGSTGGRLYMTCLCLMTLEVYYRHLPLYNPVTTKVDF